VEAMHTGGRCTQGREQMQTGQEAGAHRQDDVEANAHREGAMHTGQGANAHRQDDVEADAHRAGSKRTRDRKQVQKVDF
jgi:hypothetical protein